MTRNNESNDRAVEVYRLAAFTSDPRGGNPAGVVITQDAMPDDMMRTIARDVGYSETAFLVPADDDRRYHVRYFAPETEVAFCGHATIAAAVLLGQIAGAGGYDFVTPAGNVSIDVLPDATGYSATMTSVAPRSTEVEARFLSDVLATLGWGRQDLDPRIPPRLVYAGAWHLLLATASRERLATVDYDFDTLRDLMAPLELATVAIIWREDERNYHSRNLFPPGGVVEDPATGAAAAALGGYLRELEGVVPPCSFVVHQGVDMGRPSSIHVTVPTGSGGIAVTGTAVAIEG